MGPGDYRRTATVVVFATACSMLCSCRPTERGPASSSAVLGGPASSGQLQAAYGGIPPEDFINGSKFLSPDMTAAVMSDAAKIVVRDFAEPGARTIASDGSDPVWSADNGWIIYQNAGLCAVRRDGRVHHRIYPTDLPPNQLEYYLHPSWPAIFIWDGKVLRLLALDGSYDRVLLTQESLGATSPLEPVSPGIMSVSPDGNWLCYTSRWHGLGYLRLDRAEHWVLTETFKNSWEPRTLPWALAWTPDPNVIYVLMKPKDGGATPGRAEGFDVWRVHLDSGRATALIRCWDLYFKSGGISMGRDLHDFLVRQWNVSPDGKWVAMYATQGDIRGPFIFFNTETGSRYGVVEQQSEVRGCFSPDSSWFAFAQGDGVHCLEVAGNRKVTAKSGDPDLGLGFVEAWTLQEGGIRYRGPLYFGQPHVLGLVCPEEAHWKWKIVAPYHASWDAVLTETTYERREMEGFDRVDYVPDGFHKVPSAYQEMPTQFKELPLQDVAPQPGAT